MICFPLPTVDWWQVARYVVPAFVFGIAFAVLLLPKYG